MEKFENGTLNRTDIIALVAQQLPLNKTQTAEVVKVLESTLIEEVAKGNTVTLAGFIQLGNKVLKAGDTRNPKTGEIIYKNRRVKPFAKPMTGFDKAVSREV